MSLPYNLSRILTKWQENIQNIKANINDLDGHWFSASKMIINNVSLYDPNNTPIEISIADLFKNSDDLYELTLSITLTTGSTAGNMCSVMISSSLDNFSSAPYYCIAVTRVTGSASASAYGQVLVNGAGSLKISRNSSWRGNATIRAVYARKVH